MLWLTNEQDLFGHCVAMPHRVPSPAQFGCELNRGQVARLVHSGDSGNDRMLGAHGVSTEVDDLMGRGPQLGLEICHDLVVAGEGAEQIFPDDVVFERRGIRHSLELGEVCVNIDFRELRNRWANQGFDFEVTFDAVLGQDFHAGQNQGASLGIGGHLYGAHASGVFQVVSGGRRARRMAGRIRGADILDCIEELILLDADLLQGGEDQGGGADGENGKRDVDFVHGFAPMWVVMIVHCNKRLYQKLYYLSIDNNKYLAIYI